MKKLLLLSFTALFTFLIFIFTVPKFNTTSAACNPTFTDVSRSEGTSSITWVLNLHNTCGTTQTFSLTSPGIPSGWKYLYSFSGSNCSTNTACSITIGTGATKRITLKITRPTGETPGSYTVKARAANAANGTTFTLSPYIVCTSCADKGYQCSSFSVTCNGVRSTLYCGVNGTVRCSNSSYTCNSAKKCIAPATPTPRPATPTPVGATPTPTPGPTCDLPNACSGASACPGGSDDFGQLNCATGRRCCGPAPVATPTPTPTPVPPAPTGGALGSCGRVVNGITVTTLDCIFPLIQTIINWALIFAGSIALIFIVFGAIQFLTSAGDPKKAESAKKTITLAIVGIVLVFLSFAIINTIAIITGVSCINVLGFNACT